LSACQSGAYFPRFRGRADARTHRIVAMFLLVTGASGAGKSTVRRAIARELSPAIKCVELSDVVSMPGVPALAWRQQATEVVVERALGLQAEGRHLLLCGDPVAAGEVLAAPSAAELAAVAVCLLDVTADAQSERLADRGDDPRLVAHHHAFAKWMRGHARDPRHMRMCSPPTVGRRCAGTAGPDSIPPMGSGVCT
jgi:energy-coupling factor transporter ATP-binding protein EcfA2